MTDEERAEFREKREPVVLATDRMLTEGVLTQTKIDKIHEEALAEVEATELFADESAIARPSEAELLDAVFAS